MWKILSLIFLLHFAYSLHEDKVKQENICDQPLQIGSCRALESRYYYDKESKECKEFTYGGCHGNENNFENYEQCYVQCILLSQGIEEAESATDLTKEFGTIDAMDDATFEKEFKMKKSFYDETMKDAYDHLTEKEKEEAKKASYMDINEIPKEYHQFEGNH
ncbi:hypothetical protein SNEBB_005093 [Seison nebaliae]|nr:hypothetical protein SNEBB_005093 [Seison nebaliae]